MSWVALIRRLGDIDTLKTLKFWKCIPFLIGPRNAIITRHRSEMSETLVTVLRELGSVDEYFSDAYYTIPYRTTLKRDLIEGLGVDELMCLMGDMTIVCSTDKFRREAQSFVNGLRSDEPEQAGDAHFVIKNGRRMIRVDMMYMTSVSDSPISTISSPLNDIVFGVTLLKPYQSVLRAYEVSDATLTKVIERTMARLVGFSGLFYYSSHGYDGKGNRLTLTNTSPTSPDTDVGEELAKALVRGAKQLSDGEEVRYDPPLEHASPGDNIATRIYVMNPTCAVDAIRALLADVACVTIRVNENASFLPSLHRTLDATAIGSGGKTRKPGDGTVRR